MFRPSANVEPEAGEQVTVRAPSTRSEAVGEEYETTAPLLPVASATRLEGVPLMPAVWYLALVSGSYPWPCCRLRPCSEQLTAVVAMAKVLPDAGVQVTRGFNGLASLAVTKNVATAPVGPVASRT